jgi:hypothetical protein
MYAGGKLFNFEQIRSLAKFLAEFWSFGLPIGSGLSRPYLNRAGRRGFTLKAPRSCSI